MNQNCEGYRGCDRVNLINWCDKCTLAKSLRQHHLTAVSLTQSTLHRYRNQSTGRVLSDTHSTTMLILLAA